MTPHLTEELAACPFCGGPAYRSETVNGTAMLYVGCSECGLSMKAAWVNPPSSHPAETAWSRDLVAAWNRRPHPPAKDHQHVFREVLHDAERRCVTCGTSEVSEAFVRGLQAANQEVERLRADAEDIAEYRDTIRLQNEMYRELRARCARLEGALTEILSIEVPAARAVNHVTEATALVARCRVIARLALAPVGGDPDL